jgi:hypothetical protein
MKRRNFLKLTGLAAAGTAALPSMGLASVSTEDAMARLIRNEFHYLKLDEAGLNQFVANYLDRHYHSTVSKIKLRSYYFLNFSSTQSQLVNQLTRRYILSTDFFSNKMDESKPVQYMGLYNAYKTPCANPFSAIFYPPDQIS